MTLFRHKKKAAKQCGPTTCFCYCSDRLSAFITRVFPVRNQRSGSRKRYQHIGMRLVRGINHGGLSQVHLAIFSEQYYCFTTAYLFHFSCRFFVLAVLSVTCSIECAAREKQTLRQRTFPARKCGFFVISRFLNVRRRRAIPAAQTYRSLGIGLLPAGRHAHGSPGESRRGAYRRCA